MNLSRHLGWALGAVLGAAIVSAPPAANLAKAVDTDAGAASVSPMGNASFADVVEAVSPAVVNIAVTKTVPPMPAFGRPDLPRGPRGQMDDFLGRFFDAPDMPQGRQERQGLGSGFLVDADGYVVTNNHVIDGATEITVTLQDERQFDAELVGQDPKTDLALLKIEGGDALPFVELGDSDRIRVGDWVLAIGNPFGFGGTATAGIVSARGRDIQSGPYDDYLQLDAPINSGNSGGPVFGADGKVIGVNTAIFSPSGGNVGIGFAIPANQVETIVSELKTTGTVSRGWLGVQIQGLDEDLAASLGLESTDGALIAAVTPDSPAAEAGLETGDVITEIDANAVDSPRTLSRLVGDSDPSDTVSLTLWRAGARHTVEVTLGDSNPATASDQAPRAPGDRSEQRLGLALGELTPQHRAQLGMAENAGGVLVSEVERASPAAEKGLRAGDVLLEVDGLPVASAAEAVAAIEAAKSESEQVLLLLRRGNSQRFVSIALG